MRFGSSATWAERTATACFPLFHPSLLSLSYYNLSRSLRLSLCLSLACGVCGMRLASAPRGTSGLKRARGGGAVAGCRTEGAP